MVSRQDLPGWVLLPPLLPLPPLPLLWLTLLLPFLGSSPACREGQVSVALLGRRRLPVLIIIRLFLSLLRPQQHALAISPSSPSSARSSML